LTRINCGEGHYAPAVTEGGLLLKRSYTRQSHPPTGAGGSALHISFIASELKGFVMKAQLGVITVFAALVAVSSPAEAKGCVKGAAVGGVAGHVAGHHGLLGAAAGCVVGRHRANKAAKQQQVQQEQQERQIQNSGTTTDRDTTTTTTNGKKHG
jgi:hypothetical protein